MSHFDRVLSLPDGEFDHFPGSAKKKEAMARAKKEHERTSWPFGLRIQKAVPTTIGSANGSVS
jgi:hypothetical protein